MYVQSRFIKSSLGTSNQGNRRRSFAKWTPILRIQLRALSCSRSSTRIMCTPQSVSRGFRPKIKELHPRHQLPALDRYYGNATILKCLLWKCCTHSLAPCPLQLSRNYNRVILAHRTSARSRAMPPKKQKQKNQFPLRETCFSWPFVAAFIALLL